MWCLCVKKLEDFLIVGPFNTAQEAAAFAAKNYSGRPNESAFVTKMVDPGSVNPDKAMT